MTGFDNSPEMSNEWIVPSSQPITMEFEDEEWIPTIADERQR